MKAANELQKNDTFLYLDKKFTVARIQFTKDEDILHLKNEANEQRKMTFHEYNGYVYYGFIK